MLLYNLPARRGQESPASRCGHFPRGGLTAPRIVSTRMGSLLMPVCQSSAGVVMHEDAILGILETSDEPLSITKIRELLSKGLKRNVPHETVRKDLLKLSAKGLISCASIEKGNRTTRVFWSDAEPRRPSETLTEPDDPFDVSLANRDRMNPEELASLYDAVVDRCQDIIWAKLRRGSRYLILCEGKIVKTADREPSDEDVRRLERRFGKVCYVLTQDRIEESRWGLLGSSDYCQTIEAFGRQRMEWNPRETLSGGPKHSTTNIGGPFHGR